MLIERDFAYGSYFIIDLASRIAQPAFSHVIAHGEVCGRDALAQVELGVGLVRDTIDLQQADVVVVGVLATADSKHTARSAPRPSWAQHKRNPRVQNPVHARACNACDQTYRLKPVNTPFTYKLHGTSNNGSGE